jgi:hypothetical protein
MIAKGIRKKYRSRFQDKLPLKMQANKKSRPLERD